MKQEQNKTTRRIAALAALCTGTAMIGIPSCEGVLTTFNPCGTVFAFCEGYEIDLLFADTPDFNLDPTCTIPFFGVYGDGAGGGGTGSCSGTVIYPQTPGTRPEGQQP